MILNNGSKVLVSHRRVFEGDQPRFFVGEVEGYENGIVKVGGYTFGRTRVGQYARKSDRRSKIFSIASGTILVYELSDEVEIDNVTIVCEGLQTWLTDGQRRLMDLSDHSVAMPSPASV